MILAEGEYEKLPEKIKREINLLHLKDRLIYEAKKNHQDINLLVIEYVIDSITTYFKFSRKVDKKIKNLLQQSLARIPITFFLVDKLKVKKKIKKEIETLFNIVPFAISENEKIIKSTFKRLMGLKNEYQKPFFKLKVSFPLKVEKKFFDKEDLRLVKSILDFCKKEYEKIINNKNKVEVAKRTSKIFCSLLQLYLSTKNNYLKKKYLPNLLSELAFLFYYNNINLPNKLKVEIFEFIDISHIINVEKFIKEKYKKLLTK